MSLSRHLRPVQLRLILRICETGKLQTAAADVGMSQPAASRMLAEIERTAGAPLFLRDARGMTPTPAGTAFQRHARQLLQGLDSLEGELRDLNAGQAGSVRIGPVTGPAVGILVPAIRAVRARAPGVEFFVEIGPSTQLVRALEEDGFDFVIARLPPDHDSRNFRLFPARNEVVSLLTRSDHPLAGAKGLSLAALSGFEWVIQDRGSPIRSAVEAAFAAAGVRMPGLVTNSSSLLMVLALLEGSDAIAPMSREVALLLTGQALGLKAVQLNLEHQITVSPYFLIRRADHQLPPVAEQLMEDLLRRF
ncbi:MAG: LysR family transcriptional regulator [Pseudooceanicola sp.]|nr:LysR family transcriptional regulator [Pseudooceanicola sp.]